jgi:hypothetical protein
VEIVCTGYREAAQQLTLAIHTVSVDEMAGIRIRFVYVPKHTSWLNLDRDLVQHLGQTGAQSR